MATKRLLLGVVLVAVLAGAGAATYLVKDSRAKETARKDTGGKGPGKGAGTVPVLVAPAAQQTLAVTAQAIGNVEAYASVAVKARIDGQILDVNFQEGKEVRKGDILFRIDPRLFDAALKQSEAQALRDIASRDRLPRKKSATRNCSTRISFPRMPTRSSVPTRPLRKQPHERARPRSKAPGSTLTTR